MFEEDKFLQNPYVKAFQERQKAFREKFPEKEFFGAAHSLMQTLCDFEKTTFRIGYPKDILLKKQPSLAVNILRWTYPQFAKRVDAAMIVGSGCCSNGSGSALNAGGWDGKVMVTKEQKPTISGWRANSDGNYDYRNNQVITVTGM